MVSSIAARTATVNASGLPVPVGAVGNSAEIAVMEAMKYDTATKANFNAGGMDTEAIVFDRKRNVLWISDEYGPFIVKLDSDGNAPYAVTGKSEAIERFARFTRWTEFDPVTGASGKMYAYPIDGSAYLDGRTGNAELTVLPWHLTTTTTLA